MRFNSSGPIRSSPLNAARVANRLQRDSKLPLLLAADIERELHHGSRMSLRSLAHAFGAVGDERAVERFAAITAQESRAIGSVGTRSRRRCNSNPANPVINDRSFGEDPEQVGTLVAAFIRGAHEYGYW